jgi:anti-sigma factor RsiW
MITCRELTDLLFDFVADDLPPHRRDAIAQHLQECSPCFAYWESYRITIHLARRLPCPPPPADVLERLQGALHASLQAARGSSDQTAVPPPA